MPPAQSLGDVYAALNKGDWAGARQRCQALLAEGDHAPVHHALGLACCGEGAWHDAATHFAQARARDAVTYRFARDAAAVDAVLGQWRRVLDTLGPWLDTLAPDDACLYLAAAARTASASHVEAFMSRAQWAAGATGEVRVACADALLACDRLDDARTVVDALDDATRNSADGLDVRARLLEATGEPDAGLACHVRRATMLPDSARVQLQVALALQNRGRADESRAARERATALGLERPEDRSTRLYLMLGDPEVTPDGFLEASRAVFDGTNVPPPEGTGRRTRRGRLRVGYVSAEFRSTPSYHFTSSFLKAHDRSEVETFLYNCSTRDDGLTAVYATLGEHWRHLGQATVAETREAVLRDELDVLVDLSGHFPGNRLRLLCEHLAPVQVTYPHFPGTTGCPGMDVLLTDQWTSPEGTEAEYTETLYRLPGGYLAYTPPIALPSIEEPPAPCTTFGMFQRLAKLHAAVWDAVAGVLTRVPGSRLLIHNGDASLDCPDSETTRRLQRELAVRDVDPARLVARGPLPIHEHLALMTTIDVMLDTFPYAGQTTTMEALLMGVPVVTCTTGTHVSRVGGALVARAGHPEWAARSLTGYMDRAARVAEDARNPRLRSNLREETLAAGLTDGRRLARELEDAFRGLVR